MVQPSDVGSVRLPNRSPIHRQERFRFGGVSGHSGSVASLMGELLKTSRSGRAPALPADERREAIIRATLPLLLEHAEMVSTRQIAEAAGIGEIGRASCRERVCQYV